MNVAVHDLQTLFEVGSLGGLSDGQLLDRFVARREGAVFEAIVHRHGPMVWGVCRRVLRDHHDAEDAFQATFLVLARKAASVMIREKLGNWLYGVAYQTAMKARAIRTKRRVREVQVSDMPEPMMVPHDLRDALAESLDRELSRLPEKYRIPIVLCDLEGRTHKEAASQLGWPIGTVSSRLSRARTMLARRLSRPGVTLSGVSLAVLLAQDVASASMPTQLIGSTVQAARLFAAGGAMTAGVVSAEVGVLIGEVLKVMLLGKLKITTAMLLVVSALAAGGTSLTYRARATEPTIQGAQATENTKPKDDSRSESNDARQGGTKPPSSDQPLSEGRSTGHKSKESSGADQSAPDRKQPNSGEPGRKEQMPPQRPYQPQRQNQQNGQDQQPQGQGQQKFRSGWSSERGGSEDQQPQGQGQQKSQDQLSGGQNQQKGQDQLVEDPLADQIMAGAHTSEQLERAQKLIESMLTLEKEAHSKSPDELDKMIQDRTKRLEEARWQVRVMEAQLRRLKMIREATQDGTRSESPYPPVTERSPGL
jgi:RNA polymerase sigma factor (sigma-70 family)